MYKEECTYEQIKNDVHYIQKYDTVISSKNKKKEIFEKGCQIVQDILNN